MDDDQDRISTGYAPGTWRLLCGPYSWLLADTAVAATLDELWLLVDGVAPLASILERLGAAGAEAVPAFALAHLSVGEEKVVLRGAATVRLESPSLDTVELVCPTGITTWLEHPVSGAVETVTLVGEGAAATAGVYPARRAPLLPPVVVISRAGGPAPVGAVEAAPVAVPAAAPAAVPVPAPVPVPVAGSEHRTPLTIAFPKGTEAEEASGRHDHLFTVAPSEPAAEAP